MDAYMYLTYILLFLLLAYTTDRTITIKINTPVLDTAPMIISGLPVSVLPFLSVAASVVLFVVAFGNMIAIPENYLK